MHDNHADSSKVENSAHALSYLLKFVHGFSESLGRNDTQHNNIHHNDIMPDTMHKDIQHNIKGNAKLSIMALNKECRYAECRKQALSEECCYAECRYAECRSAKVWRE
jgi:hypothetical protein